LSENNSLVRFTNKQGYLNEFNERIFVKGTVGLSRILYGFDRYVVDGLTKLFSWFVRQLSAVVYWFDKHIVDGLVNLTANVKYYIHHLVPHDQNELIHGNLCFRVTIVIFGILYFITKYKFGMLTILIFLPLVVSLLILVLPSSANATYIYIAIGFTL